MLRSWVRGLFAFGLAACTAQPSATPPPAGAEDSGVTVPDASTPPASPDAGAPEPVRITHAFGELDLEPSKDDPDLCVQWTVGNTEPLYVNAVQMSNLGYFHHSNWFVVAEDSFEGPDGYFKCSDRRFDTVLAAGFGTVLFAQSTQSYDESQRLRPGAVIKIPPGAKVMANAHTLNTAPRPAKTELWLTLEPIHPRDVTAVVTAISIQYHDLAIPPLADSRFTTSCDFQIPYRLITGDPVAMRVHYVLPHYHYLGNSFSLDVVGGLHDGESVYSISEFNGEPNGKTFDPPLELSGAVGFKLRCGYRNWRDEVVGWGNGDGEMCVALILAETGAVLGGTAQFGNRRVGEEQGVAQFEAPCFPAAYPRRGDQGMPSQEEKSGPLHLPPVDPNDRDLPPVPACRDVDPAAAPEAPATLSSIKETILAPACSFSACHGAAGAGGLTFVGPDLHSALIDHQVRSNAGMPLVSPGEPERSWLYRKIARCVPTDAQGAPVSHMPLNAPVLLDGALVAKVRAWIAAGARDD